MGAASAAHVIRPASVLDPSVIRRWVEQTCEAQGVPVAVSDSRVLAKLAVLFTTSGTREHPRQAMVA